MEKLKRLENYGKGFIDKYMFTNFDDWDKFKQEALDSEDSHPWNIDRRDWIDPDRIPFILLYIYDGAGGHNMEFVYPDDFPGMVQRRTYE